MSSQTPELDGETNTTKNPTTITGALTLLFRWAYNTSIIGFAFDMVLFGTLGFVGIVGTMLAYVALSKLLGGLVNMYILFVLTSGTYGAYRNR